MLKSSDVLCEIAFDKKAPDGMKYILKVYNMKRLNLIAKELKMKDENLLEMAQRFNALIDINTNYIVFYDVDDLDSMKEFILSTNVIFKLS